MRTVRGFVLLLVAALPSMAQLSAYQKRVDFEQLVGLFDKQYAFVEWKKSAAGFDALNAAPWLEKVAATQSDAEFFELCMLYVASLQDSHAAYHLPSDFVATLGFTVDIYSGRYLIDSIDRTVLGNRAFGAQVGDELVSIDGVRTEDLVARMSARAGQGNARAQKRLAAYFATVRLGALHPEVARLGDTATVVVNQQSGGPATYTVPWTKSGTPYGAAGPVPDLALAGDSPRRPTSWAAWLTRLQWMRAGLTRGDTRGASHNTLRPVFALPASFTPHAGGATDDIVYSGVYQSGNLNIGYLRIPDFDATGDIVRAEIAWLRDKSDGLVIDLMGNPGGGVCEAESDLMALTTKPFTSLRQQRRVTFSDLSAAKAALDSAVGSSQSEALVAFLTVVYSSYLSAYQQSRGLSDALPLCGISQSVQPLQDKAGLPVGYARPVLILTDDFTASTAEVFAAIAQDNAIATVYGYRTNGAGGAVEEANVGAYSEGSASVTRSILVRGASQFIENTGVQPDLPDDFMTTDNLLNRGQTFVNGFTLAIGKLIAATATGTR